MPPCKARTTELGTVECLALRKSHLFHGFVLRQTLDVVSAPFSDLPRQVFTRDQPQRKAFHQQILFDGGGLCGFARPLRQILATLVGNYPVTFPAGARFAWEEIDQATPLKPASFSSSSCLSDISRLIVAMPRNLSG